MPKQWKVASVFPTVALAGFLLLFLAGAAIVIRGSFGATKYGFVPARARSVGGGTSYHVSPNGSDSATGSAARPWRTIGHAATKIRPGDTVHVAPGDYFENVETGTSGTAAARIRFVSDTKWGAKIIASGGFSSATVAWQNRGNYVTIQGFDISGNVSIGIDNESSFSSMIGNHIHNLSVPCTNAGGAGIVNGNNNPQPGVNHDSDIIGNRIHDIGDLSTPEPCPWIPGIYQQIPGGQVLNNIIYRTATYGIETWQRAAGVVISNNLVFENRIGGIAIGTEPPEVADRFLIANNIAIYNGVGIYEVDMLNNNPQRIGANNRYFNNLVYGNHRGGVVVTRGSAVRGTMSGDPRLANYRPDGTGDYHLKAGSPCIGAGTSEGAPTSDFDGVSRPRGAACDIGPYQWRR